MKKTINKLFLTLLLHEIILLAIQIPLMNAGVDEGWLSIAGTGAACIFALLFNINNTKEFLTRKSERRMTFGKFVLFLCFLSAGQIIGALFAGLFEALGIHGAAITDTIINNLTFSLFLYAALLGPLIEELVYRGTVGGTLRKYGRGFAIVVSAMIFGLMHMTLEQFLTATLLGLVLGYVFEEYSIWWSVALHIANNLVFAVGVGYTLRDQPEASNIVSLVLLGAGTIAAIIYTAMHRKEIGDKLRDLFSDTAPGAVKTIFKSVWFWIYFLLLISGIVLDIVGAGML